ncbi:MAG: hypothetical protein V1756_00840 [Patescibacteria group bacterium]
MAAFSITESGPFIYLRQNRNFVLWLEIVLRGEVVKKGDNVVENNNLFKPRKVRRWLKGYVEKMRSFRSLVEEKNRKFPHPWTDIDSPERARLDREINTLWRKIDKRTKRGINSLRIPSEIIGKINKSVREKTKEGETAEMILDFLRKSQN